MRVDKFLWCIRAFKTRSLATNHCREAKVFLGEKAVKPAQEVHAGDVIRVRKG
ncbi:MAG: S4 domain-containing protein, partial [Flavobacteriales bacterium]